MAAAAAAACSMRMRIMYFDRPSPTTASAGKKEKEREMRERICVYVCTHSAHQQIYSHTQSLTLSLSPCIQPTALCADGAFEACLKGS